MKGYKVAVIVALAIAVVWLLAGALRSCGREKFVSRTAMDVFTTAKPLFDKTEGGATYTDYKSRVKHADPVQYADLKKLWKEKKLTPEAVQENL